MLPNDAPAGAPLDTTIAQTGDTDDARVDKIDGAVKDDGIPVAQVAVIVPVPVVPSFDRAVLLAYNPVEAIGLGFAGYRYDQEMLKLLAAKEETEDGEDPVAGTEPDESPPLETIMLQRAASVLARFRAFAARYAVGSAEWIYLGKIESAALSFQAGLAAMKSDHQQRCEQAEDHRYREIERSVLTATIWGMARGAIQVGFTFGLFYSVAKLIGLYYPAVVKDTAVTLGMAAGFVAGLFMIAWLVGKTGRAHDSIEIEFRGKLRDATARQTQGHLQHFKLAMAIATSGYKELTGEAFPDGNSVEIALHELMDTATREFKELKKPNTLTIAIRLARIGKKLVNWRRRVHTKQRRPRRVPQVPVMGSTAQNP